MERLTIDKLNDQGCVNILCALMKNVSKEYRDALHTLKMNPKDKNNLEHIKHIREFFTSDYFSDLTNLDGTAVAERLERLYLPKKYISLIKENDEQEAS